MSANVSVDWLSKAIAQSAKSVKYCVSGTIPGVDPGLVVEGLGAVKMPLSPKLAKSLVAFCRVAPYGKGTRTLVDRNVRNALELDPKEFRLGTAWNEAVAGVAMSAANELGLPADRVETRLYKLLVYERGGFFLSHRDSEKHDRMLASLVVVLPGDYDGGTLVVRHGPKEAEFKFEDASKGKSACYAVFYADCEHEVRYVSRGRRACLTYNLVLKPTRGKRAAKPARSDSAEALADVIEGWFARQPTRPLVFALEHRYSQRGLSPDLLKGEDRRLAERIVPAAEQAGCLVHLCQLERHLMQFADDGSLDDGYRRGRRFDYAPKRKITVGETYSDDFLGAHWVDVHGKQQPWGAIAIDPAAIVSSVPFDQWTPTSEEFEGYTGNAGNTLDRWYHRSAIVLWRRDRHFDVIAAAGPQDSIPLFCAMVARLAKAPKSRCEAARGECARFALAIIGQWPTRTHWNYQRQPYEKSHYDDFAIALTSLHDREAIAAFLAKLADQDHVLRLTKLVIESCREFGWDALSPELRQLLSARPSGQGTDGLLPRDAEWLSEFCCDEAVDPGKTLLAGELCALAAERFCRPPDARRWHEPSRGEKMLVPLLMAATVVGPGQALGQLLDFVHEHPGEFPIGECQVPSLVALIPWAKKRVGAVPPPIVSWLAQIRQRLQQSTAKEPAPPSDWRRPANVGCKCSFCAQLNAFLSDPTNEVGRIAGREDAREHLKESIRQFHCDVAHALDKKGRPFSLALTKTTGSYDRALKQYHLDVKLLEKLATLGVC